MLIIISLIILLTLCSAVYHHRGRPQREDSPVWIDLNKPFFNETLEGDMIFVENSNTNKTIGSVRYLPKGLHYF